MRKYVLNTKYQIGMRVVKTVLAVMVCSIIHYFADNPRYISVSAIAAIVALQTSGGETLKTAGYQITGTFIGGILGVFCAYIGSMIPLYAEGLYIIIIPLMIMIALYVCNVFKLQNAVVMACMVILFINSRLDIPFSEALFYSGSRVIETLVGVSVSGSINFIFKRRKKIKYFSVKHD